MIYIHSLYEDGEIETRFVAPKTKIAPVNRQSIPCLKLLGALILARLTIVVKPSIQSITKCFFWIDSMTALYWIRNNKVWKQYVNHQVEEIRRLTIRSDWRYCPGISNPADLPSCDITASELVSSELWWKGFQFLHPLYKQPPKPLLVCQFGLFLDEKDSVIRCQGQLNNSLLPSKFKNPILLPNGHHFVSLIIQQAHMKLMHSGVRKP